MNKGALKNREQDAQQPSMTFWNLTQQSLWGGGEGGGSAGGAEELSS